MQVLVNGHPHAYAEHATLAAVLDDLGAAPRGVAVAVNGEVVRRALWPQHRVREGDTVEVLTAVQGG